MCFFDLAFEHYLKYVVMHLLMVGNTLLSVNSHWIQGVSPQPKDPFCSRNLVSGITYIFTIKICFELCLQKHVCTSVGDSHQCVWCCFLFILNAVGRKISINSSFEVTWVTRSTSSAFLTSCYVHRSHLLRLKTFGSRSACCPPHLWDPVKLFLRIERI